MVTLKIGKTAIFVALETVLNNAARAADELGKAAAIARPTVESHGPLVEDIRAHMQAAENVFKDVCAYMEVPSPRVPGIVLGIHKNEPDPHKFVVISFIRDSDIDRIMPDELVNTHMDTGGWKKVWFQPTTIPVK